MIRNGRGLTELPPTVQPADFPISLDSVNTSRKCRGPEIRNTWETHGEVLRDRTDLNVTELMIRRTRDLSQPYRDWMTEQWQVEKKIEEVCDRIYELEDEVSEQLYEQLALADAGDPRALDECVLPPNK